MAGGRPHSTQSASACAEKKLVGECEEINARYRHLQRILPGLEAKCPVKHILAQLQVKLVGGCGRFHELAFLWVVAETEVEYKLVGATPSSEW